MSLNFYPPLFSPPLIFFTNSSPPVVLKGWFIVRDVRFDVFTAVTMKRRRNMFPVGYDLGFYVPEDDILHSHLHENLKSHKEFRT
jgi:hypothetical protein